MNGREYRKCQRCEYRFAARKAQCPSCHYWHVPGVYAGPHSGDGTLLLSDAADGATVARYRTGPWDEVFDPGIVPGSTTLLGGAPGSGKSTMAIQVLDGVIARSGREGLYVSGEEQASSIRDRARRLALKHMAKMRVVPLKEGWQGDLKNVIERQDPCMVVVDSIQGIAHNDQLAAVELCQSFAVVAAERRIPVFLISHITKDGDLAGLMALQHEVDVVAVMYRRDEDASPERLFQGMKNRHGAEKQVCLVMTDKGIKRCTGCQHCRPDDEDDDN